MLRKQRPRVTSDFSQKKRRALQVH
uniref:Uncharacterized protein n=1 Tax=Anguilla anguilla TaxID=7936 RepID=A0A0E9W1C6_ANGAN